MNPTLKLGLVAAVSLGGFGYLSFQYNEIKSFEEEIYKNSK